MVITKASQGHTNTSEIVPLINHCIRASLSKGVDEENINSLHSIQTGERGNCYSV